MITVTATRRKTRSGKELDLLRFDARAETTVVGVRDVVQLVRDLNAWVESVIGRNALTMEKAKPPASHKGQRGVSG